MSIWALKNSNTFPGISKAVCMLWAVCQESRGPHSLISFWPWGSARAGNKACIRFVSHWLSIEGRSRQAHNLSTVCSLYWFQEFKEISIQSLLLLLLSRFSCVWLHSQSVAPFVPRKRLPDRAFPGAVLPSRGRWMCCAGFPWGFGLQKEMATHFSVLAWRIPGMGEPGGLLSMGSHRVRHNWSDLAAAAAVIG